MTEEEGEDWLSAKKYITDKIISGEIKSYFQLLIQCNLLGYDAYTILYFIMDNQDDVFKRNILKLLTTCVEFDNIVGEKIINFFFDNDGRIIYIQENVPNQNITNSNQQIINPNQHIIKPKYYKVDSLALIKKFDINNPLALIRYFLKYENPKISYINMIDKPIFLNALKFTIIRCEQRGKVLKKFNEMRDRLQSVYDTMISYGLYV